MAGMAATVLDNVNGKNEEIVKYLQSLGYGGSVIEKVKTSKVSQESIEYFQKEDFTTMGIALADFYLMRAKFSNKINSTRLGGLLHEARSRHYKAVSKTKQQRQKQQNIVVAFCWYNFDRKKDKYTQVREILGGGKRVQMVSRVACLDELTNVAVNVFFPDGKTKKGDSLQNFSYYLADYCLNELSSDSFNLDTYLQHNGLKQAKMFLMTKGLSGSQKIGRLVQGYSPGNAERKYALHLHSTPEASLVTPTFNISDSDSDFDVPAIKTETLERRREIISEQHQEYQESLKADQEKGKKKADALQEELESKEKELTTAVNKRADQLKQKLRTLEEMEHVRLARANRVPMEPDRSSESIDVVVQHVQFGRMQRRFSPIDAMQAVYDWVGSLSHEPTHFKLCSLFSQDPIYPETSISGIDKSLLHMIVTEEPVANALNESITFIGHHKLSSQTVHKVMELKREKFLDSNFSQVTKSIGVSRNAVFEELIKHFKNNSEILKHKMSVYFPGELAFGDGLAREAYSLFIDQLLLKTFDGTSQFVPLLQPEFGKCEFEIVGAILFHFFINFGLFPIQFARASMEFAFLGHCSNSVLLESFFCYIAKSEAKILSSAVSQGTFVRSEIVDALSPYGITTNPTTKNITELVCKVAKNELITKPLPALQAIADSFKEFSNDFDNDCIQAMYDVATPTNVKVEEYISYPVPSDKIEEKAYGFLRRYVKEAGPSLLQDFLKFTTGSSFILPGAQIGVNCQIMNDIEMRPMSQTCVKLLTIPKNIPTYHAFQSKLNFYIQKTEYWEMED